jgi:hypothetical protein
MIGTTHKLMWTALAALVSLSGGAALAANAPPANTTTPAPTRAGHGSEAREEARESPRQEAREARHHRRHHRATHRHAAAPAHH